MSISAMKQALEALETLWDILDDIDTASDMAKENNAWYRKRVEALQKKRWDTTITTDGYKLKGGPVEALRQALAQEEKPPVKTYCGGKPNYCTPVDAVNMSQERVDETVKDRHDLTCVCGAVWVGEEMVCSPRKREWVGLTDEERMEIRIHSTRNMGENFQETLCKAIEAKLKEKNT